MYMTQEDGLKLLQYNVTKIIFKLIIHFLSTYSCLDFYEKAMISY